jgi:hypothetical protein
MPGYFFGRLSALFHHPGATLHRLDDVDVASAAAQIAF